MEFTLQFLELYEFYVPLEPMLPIFNWIIFLFSAVYPYFHDIIINL